MRKAQPLSAIQDWPTGEGAEPGTAEGVLCKEGRGYDSQGNTVEWGETEPRTKPTQHSSYWVREGPQRKGCERGIKKVSLQNQGRAEFQKEGNSKMADASEVS